jgi:hypothetical protein
MVGLFCFMQRSGRNGLIGGVPGLRARARKSVATIDFIEESRPEADIAACYAGQTMAF